MKQTQTVKRSKLQHIVKTVFKSVKPFLRSACANVQTNRQENRQQAVMISIYVLIDDCSLILLILID